MPAKRANGLVATIERLERCLKGSGNAINGSVAFTLNLFAFALTVAGDALRDAGQALRPLGDREDREVVSRAVR